MTYHSFGKNVEFYRKSDSMIKRDKYLKRLIETSRNGFPKVITGVRRCGKSYLLEEIYKNYLLENGVKKENIIIIELDRIVNLEYRDPIKLDDYVRSLCKKDEMYYVFIDEIQLVNEIVNPTLTGGKHILAKKDDEDTVGFVEVVLDLSREKNIDLYVTGSNSKMLSSEVSTKFRDKATNIHITPLSFEEFYSYVGGSKTDALSEYLQYGGMPLAVLENGENKKEYLKKLFQTTYFKDILEHHNLEKSESLDELCNIISESCGYFLNSAKIANTYRSVRKSNIDEETVNKYLNTFIDAYLINEVKRYDIKGRGEVGSLKKYYFVDNGLRNARLDFAFPDEGQMLENAIFNELISQGYTVNVGKLSKVEKDKNGKSVRKEYEIDFLAQKNLRQYYIQVADNINDKETHLREIKPYINLNDQIQKVVVINKPLDECRDKDGFTIIGATDFLLRFIK